MNSFPPASDQRTFEKFKADGTAKRHRGCTFVANVVEDSPSYEVCERIQDDAAEQGMTQHFALLPPSSYHMTVFPGLKDRKFIGEEARWPDWLKPASDMTKAVELIRTRLIDARDRIPALPPLRMKPDYVYDLGVSLTVHLVPADEEMAEQLNEFRSSLRDVLEIKDQHFDTYRFHCSLGYRLTASEATEQLNGELAERYSAWVQEIDTFDLERPAFNVFDDMLSFPPLLMF